MSDMPATPAGPVSFVSCVPSTLVRVRRGELGSERWRAFGGTRWLRDIVRGTSASAGAGGDEGTVDGRCQEFWRWVFSGREGGYADYSGEFTVCRGKPSRDGAVMKKKTGRVDRGKVEGGAGVGIGYIACGWEVGRGVSTCVRVVSRWVNGR